MLQLKNLILAYIQPISKVRSLYMDYRIQEVGKFKFIEKGNGEVILLLHGLFGALSNFANVIDYFSRKLRISIPLLPLYELELDETTVTGMVDHIHEFVKQRNYTHVHLLGNSLGGHIAQLYTLDHPEYVKSITLTGSSGLFENSLGDTYPKKGDYEYVKEKTKQTFYDPSVATKELIDEVYEIVNNREKALRVISMAKSALRHNLRNELHKVTVPVLLIWGKEDNITPPFVGEAFEELLPNAELHLIDKCGHAPMMERPDEFNGILDSFMEKIEVYATG